MTEDAKLVRKIMKLAIASHLMNGVCGDTKTSEQNMQMLKSYVPGAFKLAEEIVDQSGIDFDALDAAIDA